jgi:hypothetical protein
MSSSFHRFPCGEPENGCAPDADPVPRITPATFRALLQNAATGTLRNAGNPLNSRSGRTYNFPLWIMPGISDAGLIPAKDNPNLGVGQDEDDDRR